MKSLQAHATLPLSSISVTWKVASQQDPNDLMTDDPEEDTETGLYRLRGMRCILAALAFSYPTAFLTQEWDPEFPLEDSPHLSLGVDHDRRIYADAIEKALCRRTNLLRMRLLLLP
jgi:hypothetical protein